MAGQFGLSFLPGAQDPSQQAGGGGQRTGASRNPIQEAVKILSLRLPKFYGQHSLAPAPLLNAAGGMGQPAAQGNVVAQTLAQLAGLPPSMAMPQAVAPALQTSGAMSSGRRPPLSQQSNQPQSVSWPAPQPQQPPPPQQTSWAPPPPRIIPGDIDRPAGGTLYDPPSLPPPAPAVSPWTQPSHNPQKAQKYLDEDYWQQGY